jgi:hypothetical protein
MPRDFEIGAGAATYPMPQGQSAIAEPVPNPTVAEATTEVPEGQNAVASASGPVATGEANSRVPEGHSTNASPVASPSDAEAFRKLPNGQPARASASGLVVEGEASRRLPQGHLDDASTLDDICGNLMRLQRDRIFAIRSQSRGDRSVEAYIRIRLGISTDPERMSEAERKRISALAQRIKNTVERGTDQNTVADEAMAPVVRACSAVILANMAAREPWDRIRKQTEDEMRALARQLPAWSFVQGVAGVSDLGLAVIVGEAGNLGGYPKKGHLWKRLGLAVIGDMRQGNPGPGATAEDWIRHGYKRARRAEVYAFLDDVMFRQQWRGDKDADGKDPAKSKQPIAVPAHPIGPYGAYYGRKKAEYLVRWADEPAVKAHAERAARRYMSKMFVRNLWSAWRRAI